MWRWLQLAVRDTRRIARNVPRYNSGMLKKSMRCAVPFAILVAAIATAPTLLAGQSKKPAATYKAPRTPWGDPDFQGNYTNLYEAGTPLERPEQFAGKKLSDVRSEERRVGKECRS